MIQLQLRFGIPKNKKNKNIYKIEDKRTKRGEQANDGINFTHTYTHNRLNGRPTTTDRCDERHEPVIMNE